MITSFTSLVDNLSKVDNKNCKKCMKRYNTKSDVNILNIKIINESINANNVINYIANQ